MAVTIASDFTAADGTAWTSLSNQGSLGGSIFSFQSNGPAAAPAMTSEILSNQGLMRTDTSAFGGPQVFTPNSGGYLMGNFTLSVDVGIVDAGAVAAYVRVEAHVGGTTVRAEVEIGGTSCQVGGSSGSHALSLAIGDVLHIGFKGNGTAYTLYLWKNAQSAPGSPNASVTSTATTGQFLFNPLSGGAGTQGNFLFDNLFIDSDPAAGWFGAGGAALPRPPQIVGTSSAITRASRW